MLFSFNLPVQAAADELTEITCASFYVDDVIDYAQAYGLKADNAITKIPISLDIGNDQATRLIVTIEPLSTSKSGTLNFTVSGSFYRTSDNEIVSVYGLSGSFEYTGNDTKITGKSSYHTPTLKDWSGTSSTSTEYHPDLSHISVLEGNYKLYYKNKENNTAWIRIAVAEGGTYSVGGQYVSYDVN